MTDPSAPGGGGVSSGLPDAIAEYRIVRELGTGAMGRVLLAERDGVPCALKVLHEHLLSAKGFFRRFQREARAGSAIRHQNVVGVHDCDLVFVNGRPCAFIVMDYVEGRSLRTVLQEEVRLSERDARGLALDVASALVAVHAAGVVHRDLKPENLLVATDGRNLVMDLGVARILDASTHLTGEGQLAGSMLYASPEQLRGLDPGPASDLYSLGVVLLEVVTGRNPFRRRTPAEVMEAHFRGITPDPLDPRSSPLLHGVIQTLLARDPGDRFPSAAELHEVLAMGESSGWWRQQRRPQPPRGSATPAP